MPGGACSAASRRPSAACPGACAQERRGLYRGRARKARAELDLLDLDDLLLLARLVAALLLLVFELAEIEDLDHRRVGVGSDLDEIETGLQGALQGLAA